MPPPDGLGQTLQVCVYKYKAGCVCKTHTMAWSERHGGEVEGEDPAGVRILTPDGTELRGRARAAQVLAQLADSEHELEVRVGRTVVSGPVALCTQLWRRRSRGAEEGFEDTTTSRLVLARGEEDWEIVIVSPWE